MESRASVCPHGGWLGKASRQPNEQGTTAVNRFGWSFRGLEVDVTNIKKDWYLGKILVRKKLRSRHQAIL